MAKIKVKTIHALSWFFGNACTRKCYDDTDKQRACYERMKSIIAGYEDFMLTHKLFVWAMREKHKACGLSDIEFRKRDPDFWRRIHHGT